MKEIEVVAAIIKHNNKILCTQRDVSKNEEVSFKWEFPGGKIEVGETNEEALKRGIKEELNIEVNIEKYFMEVNYIYPSFKLKMYTYLCNTQTDNIELLVHKDYKWLRNDELNTLDWAPADKPIINKLMEEV